MDGGLKQEEMASWLKREVKQRSHRRSRDGYVPTVDKQIPSDSVDEASATDLILFPRNMPERTFEGNPIDAAGPDVQISNADLQLQSQDLIRLTCGKIGENISPRRSEYIYLMFYLEHTFPFLFPFYDPSLLEGGKAWVLELMIKSAVVRQATLCQSSYFFLLARGPADSVGDWENTALKISAAFEVLRQALALITNVGVKAHMHGAARLMASVMQLQRFELAISSFDNSKAHLDAALALFQNLLDNSGVDVRESPKAKFTACINRLAPLSEDDTAPCDGLPSAEQAAFRFSSALLVLDDIIASTTLQTEPRLYAYQRSLLGHDDDDAEPVINLGDTLGCQNWALLGISDIAMLDAWKQQCKRAGNLDVMDLVYRAAAIRTPLLAQLNRLEVEQVDSPDQTNNLLDILTRDYHQRSQSSLSQSRVVTRVWAHAALLYLSIVVSGWQPASADVVYHVGRVIELLRFQLSSPALLRTMVWPFCVAGCLAEPGQEPQLRSIVKAMQPPSVFGTIHKALEVMEDVWRHRNAVDAASWDLATFFRNQGCLVLLV